MAHAAEAPDELLVPGQAQQRHSQAQASQEAFPDAGDEHPTVILPQPRHIPTEPDIEGPGQLAPDDSSLDLRWGVADDDPPVEAGTESRRRGLLLGGAAAAVIAVAAAAVLVAGYVGDSGMRSALASSTRDFNAVMTALSAAADPSAVAAAADSAESAAKRIDSARDRLGEGNDPEHVSVANQLEAEQGVLLAVAQLDAVASDPLATWGKAHAELTTATGAEDASREALARYNSDAAGQLAATSVMLSKVTAAVGPALVEDATDESTRLLKTLESAASTADLRKLGDTAAPEQSAVNAAAKALPAGDGKEVLTGYGAALGALADLSKINADNTSSWGATRAELARTFGQVAASAGSTGGSNVRVVLDGALNSADKVASAAAASIADWKAKTAAAIKDRDADAESLESYASFFRTQVKTYEQSRVDLGRFTDRVEDPTAEVSYFEGYQFLSQAAEDRRFVRDAMVGMDVPAGVRGAHESLVSEIDRAIAAVQSAYDGLEQSEDCYYYDDCPYYRDTPGWQRFQSESEAISKAYSSAMSKWEGAVAAEKAAITSRVLPAKPAV